MSGTRHSPTTIVTETEPQIISFAWLSKSRREYKQHPTVQEISISKGVINYNDSTQETVVPTNKIGSGTYGKLFEVKSTTSGKVMVVKKEKPHGNSYNQAAMMKDEDAFNKIYLRELGPSAIFGDLKSTDEPRVLLMPKIPGVPLAKIKFKSAEHFIKICKAIAAKLDHSHTILKHVHGDLSATNLHVDQTGGRCDIYLLDGGFARAIGALTIGARALYQHEELCEKIPAHPGQDIYSFGYMMRHLYDYYSSIEFIPGFIALCNSILVKPAHCPTAADLIRHFEKIEILLYYQKQKHQAQLIIPKADSNNSKIELAKQVITTLNELTDILNVFDKTPHNYAYYFVNRLGDDFLIQLILKFPNNFTNFINAFSDENKINILQKILKYYVQNDSEDPSLFSTQLKCIIRNTYIGSFNHADKVINILNNLDMNNRHLLIDILGAEFLYLITQSKPEKLVSIFNLLSFPRAKNLFQNLDLDLDQMISFTKALFKAVQNNPDHPNSSYNLIFKTTLALLEKYCEGNKLLYRRTLCAFNQSIYQPHINGKLNSRCCLFNFTTAKKCVASSNIDKHLTSIKDISDYHAQHKILQKGKLNDMMIRIKSTFTP